MENFNLNFEEVHEMNILEMQEIDGGFIWFLVFAGAVILSSCQSVTVNIQIGGEDNAINNAEQSADSTLNGNYVPIQH